MRISVMPCTYSHCLCPILEAGRSCAPAHVICQHQELEACRSYLWGSTLISSTGIPSWAQTVRISAMPFRVVLQRSVKKSIPSEIFCLVGHYYCHCHFHCHWNIQSGSSEWGDSGCSIYNGWYGTSQRPPSLKFLYLWQLQWVGSDGWECRFLRSVAPGREDTVRMIRMIRMMRTTRMMMTRKKNLCRWW